MSNEDILNAIMSGDVTAEVDIYSNPPRQINAIGRQMHQLADCEIGKTCVFQRQSGALTGIFLGLDGDYTVMLQSVTSKSKCGFAIAAFQYYWEEVTEPATPAEQINPIAGDCLM